MMFKEEFDCRNNNDDEASIN